MNPVQQILSDVGYPTDVLVLDFECFHDKDYTLTKLSTIEYVLDPRFDFLGVASKVIPEGRGSYCTFIGKPFIEQWAKNLQTSWGIRLNGLTIVVHNAKFDISILFHKFGINPLFVIDTIDLDRSQEARASHKLADCAERYNLGAKGTQLTKLKGLHYEEMNEEQLADLGEYANNDAELEGKLFNLLLPRLSCPAEELAIARHTLKIYLEPKLMVDLNAAKILMDKMVAEKDKAIAKVKPPIRDAEKKISGDISFVELMLSKLPEGEPMPTKLGKPTKNMIPLLGPGQIPAVAKDDVGTQTLKHHEKQAVRDLIEARLAIKSWPLHIKRVWRMIDQSTMRGGFIGVPLHYYGGHTGRFSGGERLNMQNFGERVHELINSIKNLLHAPEGYELVISDSAQIEARALAYLAGQDDLVEDFRAGEDVYSKFATKIFNCPVRESRKTDPPLIKEMLETRRYLGKQSVLGLGYGMGAKRFFDNCQEEPNLAKLIKEGKITYKFIEGIVKMYRKKFSKIIEFWYALENAFRSVSQFQYSGAKILKCGIVLSADGSTTMIKLPSGRVMRYQDVHVDRDGDIRWKYGKLWGGTLAENVTQAYARDILRDKILTCEIMGFDIVHHVHDSLVAVVRGCDVGIAKVDIEKIMCESPAWGKRLPLGVKSKCGKYYA